MTGVQIVQTLAAIEAATVAAWVQWSDIPLPVGLHAVEAAVASGDWFAKGYALTTNARSVASDFRSRRIQMATLPDPSVPAVAGLLNARIAALGEPE